MNRRPYAGSDGASVSRSGFTLLELLAVMTIISILIGVGFSQFGQLPVTSTALPVVEARFHEARDLAMGERTRTRVVIHGDILDTKNPERYLRYLDIATEELDADGEGTGVWKTIGSQGFLPQGVFFDRDASAKASSLVEGANPPPDGSQITGFGKWEEGEVEFPGLPIGVQPCLYYEFNSEGICVHDGSTTPGAAVVLSRGVPGDGEEPILDDSDKVGFVIWRNGGTSIYRDTEDLKN